MGSYNKLVRDKIPEIIINNGSKPITRIMDNIEYEKELLIKLSEETNEVMNALTNEDIIEECADVAEVIIAIAELKGYSVDEFLEIRKQKFEKRGGFKEKIFLEDVEEKQ